MYILIAVVVYVLIGVLILKTAQRFYPEIKASLSDKVKTIFGWPAFFYYLTK